MLCQRAVELPRADHPSSLHCRFTQDGVKQPRHSIGSIRNELDHATALKASYRVGVAKPTQNLPVLNYFRVTLI